MTDLKFAKFSQHWFREYGAQDLKNPLVVRPRIGLDGDCSTLADTATPDSPNGGMEPADCCTNPCIADCGCRSLGRYATVTFIDVENGLPCTGCPPGSPTYWLKHGTGTLGTYRLVWDGSSCEWLAQVHDVTFCKKLDSSTTCPTDIDSHTVPDGTIQVLLFFNGTKWVLQAQSRQELFFYGEFDDTDCSGPMTFTNTITAYDPCDATTSPSMINGTAVVSFDPCTT